MSRQLLYVVPVGCLLSGLLSCSGTSKTPASVSFDVSRLAQTGEVRSLGLLVIGAPLADAMTEQQAVETADGATATTATIETTTDEMIDIGLSAAMNTLPGRQLSSSGVDGGLVIPKATNTTESSGVQVSFFSLEIPTTATTFSVDVPSGSAQNLFLYAFGPPLPDGRASPPTHVAAALNVNLLPATEQTVVFGAYSAGVLAPQVLPPSLIGLTDENGVPITSLPPDLSCLAVARALEPRADFPAEMVGRVRIGSLVSQTQNSLQPGVMVLPVGRYRLECFANYASKLFGFDPQKPVIATVEKGKVTISTAALIRLRDIVLPDDGTMDGTVSGGTTSGGTTSGDTTSGDTTGGTTGGDTTGGMTGGDTTGGNTTGDPGGEIDPGMELPAIVPRFTIRIDTEPAGMNPTRDLVEGNPYSKDNIVQAATGANIIIEGYTSDGYPWEGEVEISVRPAFDPNRWGMSLDDGKPWKPFLTWDAETSTLAPSLTARTYIVGGIGSPVELRSHRLDLRPGMYQTQTPTFQYLVFVRPIAFNGLPARIGGARYITIRADAACDYVLGVEKIMAVALGTPLNHLEIRRVESSSGVSYNPIKEHLLIAAVANEATSGATNCAFTPDAFTSLGFGIIAQNPETAASFVFSPAFAPHFFNLLNKQGVLLNGPLGVGQSVVYDAVSATAPAGSPPLGPYFTGGFVQFDPAHPLASQVQWSLDIGIH